MSEEALHRETTSRFLFLELVTEVRTNGVYVRLAPIQRSFRRIDSEVIDEVRTAEYSASTYGGWHWGLRTAPGGNTVYRLRGRRGVELVESDGTKTFIGSQQPDELRAAIERAMGVSGENETA
jgi:hypothetical protein